MRFERTGDAPAERASSHARAARGIAENTQRLSSIVHSAVDGEKHHLEFRRRLADFSRHVATENHGHDDSCRA
jgi:hypothetical protein